MSTRHSRLLGALGLVASACASPSHFADRGIVWRVDDDKTIPEPEKDAYNRYTHYFDAMLFGRIDRALTLPDEEPARDINALDEVPDSTWFENRLGRYDLEPGDIVRGVSRDLPVLPLTVSSGKADGTNPGFVVDDAAGVRFLIKLDPKLTPKLQTATAAIASRLFWAAGYHVPSENVMEITLDDLKLKKGATYEDDIGREQPFTQEYLQKIFELGPNADNGKYRVLASRFLDGKPKGGFSEYGVRKDDPNDTIPHQHRRVLRGLRVFCAWLDNTDFSPQNTLDMYVTESGRSFLRHHVIDFGQTMGAHILAHPWVSYSYLFDESFVFPSMFSFGLWVRPWEDEPSPPFEGVGRFFPRFEPDAWKEAKPYSTFRDMTKADAFWAAKIILRFERPLLEAAVAQGKLADPRAAEYLVDTLDARRRAVGIAYVRDRTALDRFRVEGDKVCATDLSVVHELAEMGKVDRLIDGNAVETASIRADGTVCFSGPKSEYEIYELQTRRAGETYLPIEVHVAGGAKAGVRGIVRDW